MRKTFLRDERREQQKQRRTAIIIGLILVGIMVFSSIAYIANNNAITQSANSQTEYGHRFTFQDTGSSTYYETKVDGVQRQFIRLPSEVAYVPVEPEAEDSFPFIKNLQQAIISFSPSDDVIQYTSGTAQLIFQDLFAQDRQIIGAVTHLNTSANITFPVVTCDNQSYLDAYNATGKVLIIQIQEANQTAIRTRENCIFIEGEDNAGILAAAERFRYGIYGFNFSQEVTE